VVCAVIGPIGIQVPCETIADVDADAIPMPMPMPMPMQMQMPMPMPMPMLMLIPLQLKCSQKSAVDLRYRRTLIAAVIWLVNGREF